MICAVRNCSKSIPNLDGSNAICFDCLMIASIERWKKKKTAKDIFDSYDIRLPNRSYASNLLAWVHMNIQMDIDNNERSLWKKWKNCCLIKSQIKLNAKQQRENILFTNADHSTFRHFRSMCKRTDFERKVVKFLFRFHIFYALFRNSVWNYQ